MTGEPRKKLTVSLALLLVCSTGILGLTLVVYSSRLNPGLPILFGAVGAIIWSLYRAIAGTSRFYHWGLDVAVALLFWMAVSAYFAVDLYMAQKSLATFAGALAFILGPQCALSSGKQWRIYAHSYLLLTFSFCIWAWVLAIGEGWETGSIPPLKGTFNNPDAFSVLPMLALMVGPGLVTRANKFWRAALFVQLGVFALSIFASGCRAAMLGCLIGGIVFLASLVKNRSSRLKELKLLLILPFALILLALPMSNFGFSVTDKLTSTFTATDYDLENTRSEVFWRGPLAILRNPLLGAGPGCFGRVFQSVRLPDHNELYINIAHNDHIEMGVELGFIGLVLWITLVYASLAKPYRLIETGRRPLAAAAIVGAVVSALVFQLFNFIVSERPALWAFCWVVGLALSFPSSREPTKELKLVRFASATLVIGLAFWAGWFGYRAVKADELKAQAKAAEDALGIQLASQLLEQALVYQPHSTRLLRRRAKLGKTLATYNRDQGELKRALDFLKAAKKASPKDILLLLELAQLQVDLEELAAARATLEQARAITPYHHIVLRRLVSLSVREGKVAEAARLLAMDKVAHSQRRVNVLTPLLHAMEIKERGAGVKLLKEWLETKPDRKWPGETLDLVLLKTAKAGHWEVARSFARLKLLEPNSELCGQALIAKFTGELEGKKREWELLTDTLAGVEPNRTHCYQTLLQVWSEVGLALNKSGEVSDHLSTILESDKRQLQARLGLISALNVQGERTKAIELAREGLQIHSRSPKLMIRLAELYEESGHFDLAVNYYRRASKLEKNNKALITKIETLKKRL